MIYSYNEIKKYIDLPLEDVVNNLIQIGHEVEEVITIENKDVIVGKIVEINKHPDADKLNICKVDINSDKLLQIICGAPNVKLNKKVIVAQVGTTLGKLEIKETEIRGELSQGMLCSLAELDIDKKYVTEEEAAGIYLFDDNSEIKLGINAYDAINLSDNLIDVSLTANRGDCLSYDGIVRDIYAVNDKKYNKEIVSFNGQFESDFKPQIVDGAFSFSTVEFNFTKIVETPINIKMHLIKNNVKPQNVVVDCANYVLLKTGLPTHAYDKDKLANGLVIDLLDKEIEYDALDGKTYTLKKDFVVVKSNDKVVSLGCVIGSEESKIDDSTSNVILEVANFYKEKVRLNSSVINGKTDASIRGEKGIDSNDVTYSIYHIVELLKQAGCEFKYSNINTCEFKEIKVKKESIDFEDVSKILGVEISIEDCKKYLANLDFSLVEDNGNVCTYVVPTHRHDIENDHDLIEEIVRMFGLDNIDVYDTVNTFVLNEKTIKSNKPTTERNLEKRLLRTNLNQVISYSLINEEQSLMFGVDNSNLIKLMMPMSKEREYYRGSLLPSLLNIHSYNFARKQKSSAMFEIGNTYFTRDDKVNENIKVSGLISGIKESNLTNIMNYDFYDLKFIVEEIARFFDTEFEFEKLESDIKEFNKYSTAKIINNDILIGYIGKLSPYVTEDDVYVFEIDITTLVEKNHEVIIFENLFAQANLVRDITIDMKTEELIGSTSTIIKSLDNLVKYNVKDIYINENTNTKSVTYTIEFNSNDIILTNEVVDVEIEKLVKLIRKEGYGFKD